MDITRKQANPGETRLVLSGPLDFRVRKELQLAIQDAQTEGMKQVILDLRDVSFIDCAALGILVQAQQELAESQTTLSLVAAPGRVLDVLHTMNIDKMMTITSAT